MDREEFIARLCLMGYTRRFHGSGHKMMFAHDRLPYINIRFYSCRIADRPEPNIPFDDALAHLQEYLDGKYAHIKAITRM